jgi:hypothetical protein
MGSQTALTLKHPQSQQHLGAINTILCSADSTPHWNAEPDWQSSNKQPSPRSLGSNTTLPYPQIFLLVGSDQHPQSPLAAGNKPRVPEDALTTLNNSSPQHTTTLWNPGLQARKHNAAGQYPLPCPHADGADTHAPLCSKKKTMQHRHRRPNSPPSSTILGSPFSASCSLPTATAHTYARMLHGKATPKQRSPSAGQGQPPPKMPQPS